MSLAGGIMGQGYQCGLLWGGALAAGAQAYRLWGPGPQAEANAVLASQKLLEAFRARTHEINCAAIIGINWQNPSKRGALKFLLRGGPLGCFRLAANYAPIAYSAIETALADNPIEPPAPPVSCTALLAHQRGASVRHTVMAAGLAGGIGLSGGACGAVGAAIWLAGVNSTGRGSGSTGLETSQGKAVLEQFEAITGGEFECAKIAGRKFASVADHAAYVREGGCKKITAVLASLAQYQSETATL